MDNSVKKPTLVSVHGAHSRQFCSHATDGLEDIILEYIRQGFSWVGITEHMPAMSDEFLPPEEEAAGLTAYTDQARFERYFETARTLQTKYKDDIQLFVGFETEFWSGYLDFCERLIEKHRPDYIVGSVHQVHDYLIDGSDAEFAAAVEAAGDLDQLYIDYFDKQFELIVTLRPAVVGHFDLIRLKDPDYKERLRKPEIWECIERNLELIQRYDMIMDFNLRALAKGQSEPYISGPILEKSLAMGIKVVPGDDSHAMADVGRYMSDGIAMLEEIGFNTDWAQPAR